MSGNDLLKLAGTTLMALGVVGAVTWLVVGLVDSVRSARVVPPPVAVWTELDRWDGVTVVRHTSGSCWLLSNRGWGGVVEAPAALCASYGPVRGAAPVEGP